MACLCREGPPLRQGGLLTAALAQTGSAEKWIESCRMARRPNAGGSRQDSYTNRGLSEVDA